jgi:hypothetical protein
MKSFEIQLYRGGTWKTDSIYDDRALAEMEARRMEESPRYGNLRIIEEIFDEKTETTKLRTIYRDKGFQDKIAQKAENLRIKDKSVLNHGKRERNYKTRRQAKKKPTANVTKIVLNLLLIALVGGAGMFALQFLSAMQ